MEVAALVVVHVLCVRSTAGRTIFLSLSLSSSSFELEESSTASLSIALSSVEDEDDEWLTTASGGSARGSTLADAEIWGRLDSAPLTHVCSGSGVESVMTARLSRSDGHDCNERLLKSARRRIQGLLTERGEPRPSNARSKRWVNDDASTSGQANLNSVLRG